MTPIPPRVIPRPSYPGGEFDPSDPAHVKLKSQYYSACVREIEEYGDRITASLSSPPSASELAAAKDKVCQEAKSLHIRFSS